MSTPVLVLKNDDTRMHAFDTVEHLVAHAGGDHAFTSADWRIFDVTGRELEAVDSGSGISGLTATDSTVQRNQLAHRIKNVLRVVEMRVEQSPPDPEDGVDVSQIEGLQSLRYDELLNRLVEIFWGPADAGGGLTFRPAGASKGRPAAQGPAAGGVAGTGTSGSGNRPQDHSGTDSVTTSPGPNVRGWWHNMFGH